MELALLMALILLNGIFAMSELALVTARKSRLQRLAEDGDRSAVIALRLGEEPTQFLSTVQIGIGILNGIVGEAALAGPLSALLQNMGMSAQASSTVATVFVVVVITYVSIVLGELVPKRIGQFNAEGIARLLALLSRPFVALLTVSTEGLLRLLGMKNLGNADMTEEDIHAMLAEGSQTGVIEHHEHQIVRNVFRLDDRQIASLMTPRNEIVYLDLSQPMEVNLQWMMNSAHSRFPVCRGGLHDVLGVITAKQLFMQCMQGEINDLTGNLHPCVYVPESLTGMKLLEHFRHSGAQMVFVVDEYGEILGIITLQNVLEALAGEFRPRDPEDVWAVQREDGVPELKDRLHLKAVPDEERGRYNTLSGMVMWLVGNVPRTGDVVEWEDWRLEVVDLDGNRVDKVLASRLSRADEMMTDTTGEEQ